MSWKTDFLQLFTSGEIEDFQKALSLKSANIPSKLYRYRTLTDENISTHRFNEIVHGELYLSHPRELNDPFEISSLLSHVTPASYSHDKKSFTKVFQTELESEIFSKIFDSDDWYNNLVTFIAEKCDTEDKAHTVRETLNNIVMSGFEDLNSCINTMTRNMFRIACFTTSSTNLPMWHHYAQSHTGICLEYDTEKINNALHKNCLFPVYYVDTLPDTLEMLSQRIQPSFGLIQSLAMKKLKDWSYEDEWRLILDAGAWYCDIAKIPSDFGDHGKSIQFMRPSKIIMGKDISKFHERKILEIGMQAGVSVVKAVKTEYKFEIE